MTKIYTSLFLLLGVLGSHAQTANDCFTLRTTSEKALPGEEICVEVQADNFDEILGLQFSIRWNPGELDFLNIDDIGLSGLDLTNFHLQPDQISRGILNMSWMDPALQGVSLPDGSALFSLCFKVKANRPVSAFVRISDTPVPIEIVKAGQEVTSSYAVLNGGIQVAFPSPPLTIASGCGQLASCHEADGSIDITVEGGNPPFWYFWRGPGNYHSESQNIDGLAGGTYLLTVMDADSAAVSARIALGGEGPVISQADIRRPTCAAAADGSISLVVEDNPDEFDYQWSTGATGTAVEGLTAGDYSVTMTDSEGCTLVRQYTLTVAEHLGFRLLLTHTDCGGANGAADLVPPFDRSYRYQWSTGAGMEDLTEIGPGAYSVTITDEETSCSTTINFEIEQRILQVAAGYTCLSTEQGPAAELNAIVFGSGSAPYTFTWSNGVQESGDSSSTIVVRDFTFYEVTVTDKLGCLAVSDPILPDCSPDGAPTGPVWPGDTDTSRLVDHYDLLPIGLAYGAEGPPRDSATIDWRPQPASPWSRQTPRSGINFMHIDTDGDGRIDAADTAAIQQNWGRQVEETGFAPPVSPRDDEGIPLYIRPHQAAPGEPTTFDIVLGDEDRPAIDVYGLAFSILYDTAAVSGQTATASFEASWLGTPGRDMITLQRDQYHKGRLDVALTRTDQSNRSGMGAIGKLHVTIEDVILIRSDEEYEMPFRIEGVRLIDVQEQESVVATPVTKALVGTTTALHPPSLNRQLQLFPVPARDRVHLLTQTLKIQYVECFDMQGRLVGRWQATTTVPVAGWKPGLYLLRVMTDQGPVIKRFVAGNP